MFLILVLTINMMESRSKKYLIEVGDEGGTEEKNQDYQERALGRPPLRYRKPLVGEGNE